MAVNKVELADGTSLIDITDSTVEASDVAAGKVFYTAAGARTVGTAQGGDPLDAWPIGSIYQSMDPTSPAELFGGYWNPIKGQFILAAAEDTDIGTEPDESVCYRVAGATGGSERVTLSEAQIPAHTHNSRTVSGYFHIRDVNGNGDMIGIIGNQNFTSTQVTWSGSHAYPSQTNVNNGHARKVVFSQSHTHDSVGGGQSHGNMPPYIAAYTWVRVEPPEELGA